MQFQRSIEPCYNSNRMFMNDSSSFLTTAASAAASQLVVPVGCINSPKQSKWAKLGRSWRPSSDIVVTTTTNDVHDTAVPSTTVVVDHETTSIGTLEQSSMEGKVQVRMIQNDVPIYNSSSSTTMNTAAAISPKGLKTLSNTTFPSVPSFSKSSNVVVVSNKESVDEQTSIFKKKSKKNTIDTKPSKAEKKETTIVLSKKYTKWEYGKVKTFVKPEVNLITNAAGTMIIKHVRGWYQKLKYRIQLVQYKLSTVNERATKKINNYQMSVQHVKTQAIIDHKNTTKLLDKQIKQSSQTLKEGTILIEYLKKENSKLRTSNTKLYQNIKELQHHNSILETTTQKSINATNELQLYLSNIENTNIKLNIVLPKYTHSIQQLQNSIMTRTQYYTIEKNNKLIYSTLLGTIVQMMQNHYSNRDTEFVTSIVNQVLNITTTTTATTTDDKVTSDVPKLVS